ncbi:MAG: serine/threonine-protein kinase, partial [Planctomycetota bacterium]
MPNPDQEKRQGKPDGERRSELEQTTNLRKEFEEETPLELRSDPDVQRGIESIAMLQALRDLAPDVVHDILQVDSEQTPDEDSQQPLVIGRFQILRELGKGGYGIVFLAYDPHLKREIALKVPRPEVLITDSLRQRFLREAKAAASLNHPNIVPVFEAGMAGPVCYIASAYCSGMQLDRWYEANRASPHSSAMVAARLADAIQHAHSRGILHRDIKPSNVLIDSAIE